MPFHSQLAIIKRDNHIIKRIPKDARFLPAAALTKLIVNCLKHHSYEKFSQCFPMRLNKKITIILASNFFRIDSAECLDSLTPSHIQNMMKYSTGSADVKFITCLTALCNVMLSGKKKSGKMFTIRCSFILSEISC
ncbi:hypothetical protein JTB14_010592 [Gonioctena quinquepunctata]|nr:hypothetical protein JTB14_010592 [Gonioctena quinquepunctata]